MVEKKSEKLEREYVIPLREKCRPVPRYKKTNKAVKTVKEFLVRHMGIRDRDLKKIKIDKYLNETLWSNGIKNPPHKIKVKAVKDGENVIVTAAELSKKVEFKKAREEKREKTAKDFVEKKKTMMQKAQEAAKPVAKKTTEETEKETEEVKEKAAAVKEEGEKIAKKKAVEKKKTTSPKKELAAKKSLKDSDSK
ncbi:50S ribosomal protein L31e [archaeon]|jgi:large subunit ribosomal protein L31e|nr:50S ribosomal protein L31e [archaeon]